MLIVKVVPTTVIAEGSTEIVVVGEQKVTSSVAAYRHITRKIVDTRVNETKFLLVPCALVPFTHLYL